MEVLRRRLFRLKSYLPNVSGIALPKHFTTFDLLCVGIGSTIGSGVFVLTGLISKEIAGPYTPLCWLVAGFASLLSAWSYAELSYKYPQSGSSYIYCYKLMGELPAYMSAACLTLEYGISAAAVARSWGEKLDVWTLSTFDINIMPSGSYGGWKINFPAALLQLVCVFILLLGVDLSKKMINVFTSLKVMLVLFMIICGFVLFNSDNLKITGGLYDGSGDIGDQDDSVNISTGGSMTAIFTGATTCFFGYVGYDEVCCLSGESKSPKSMPLAVFGTIIISTILYILASLALVGMQSYHDINVDSGFSMAFTDQGTRGWKIIGQVTAIGELVALPLVVLISFLAQPRLLFAMAQDKLAPALFMRANDQGNLVESILVSGAAFTLLALLIPFSYLESMVSAGILINFNLTNIAYINMRWHDEVHTMTLTRQTAIPTGARARAVAGVRGRESSYSPPRRSRFSNDKDKDTGTDSDMDNNFNSINDNDNNDIDIDNSNALAFAFGSWCPPDSLYCLLVYWNILSIALSTSIVHLMFASDYKLQTPLAALCVTLSVLLWMCGHSIKKLFLGNSSSGSVVGGGEAVETTNPEFIPVSTRDTDAEAGTHESEGKQTQEGIEDKDKDEHMHGTTSTSATATNGTAPTENDGPYTLLAPWFPVIPLLGISFNWFLVAQLPLSGVAFLLGYFALAAIGYINACFFIQDNNSDYDIESLVLADTDTFVDIDTEGFNSVRSSSYASAKSGSCRSGGSSSSSSGSGSSVHSSHNRASVLSQLHAQSADINVGIDDEDDVLLYD